MKPACEYAIHMPVSSCQYDSGDKDLGGVLVDILGGVAHRFDVARVVVRDLDVEFLFQRHDQLDQIGLTSLSSTSSCSTMTCLSVSQWVLADIMEPHFRIGVVP